MCVLVWFYSLYCLILFKFHQWWIGNDVMVWDVSGSECWQFILKLIVIWIVDWEFYEYYIWWVDDLNIEFMVVIKEWFGQLCLGNEMINCELFAFDW